MVIFDGGCRHSAPLALLTSQPAQHRSLVTWIDYLPEVSFAIEAQRAEFERQLLCRCVQNSATASSRPTDTHTESRQCEGIQQSFPCVNACSMSSRVLVEDWADSLLPSMPHTRTRTSAAPPGGPRRRKLEGGIFTKSFLVAAGGWARFGSHP